MADDLAALLAHYYNYYSQPSSVEDLANQYGYDRDSLATLHRNLVSQTDPQPSQWAQDHPTLAQILNSLLVASSAVRAGRSPSLPDRWEPTFHGTPDPEFQLQNKPIWSEPPNASGMPSKNANFFASYGPDEPGAIAPLTVNTADYVDIPSGSWLEWLDNRFGSGNPGLQGERPAGRPDWVNNRNWVADILGMLGKKGIRYEGLFRDVTPTYLSIDPATVRSRYDPQGMNPKAPPSIPKYLSEDE